MATAGGEEREIDAHMRLMNLANEGDLEGMKELLDSGTDVNYRDINGRTACTSLHAKVDLEDRWGSTVWQSILIPQM